MSEELSSAALLASALLGRAQTLYVSDRAATQRLHALRSSLDEPLRVALVGTLKAGKSTLLNALVGEDVAPTDARECTKIVTTYTHGKTPRVAARLTGGEVRELPVERDPGRLELDLGRLSADEVEHLDVTWPASALAHHTLIDTPGTASLSLDVSDRTWQFLVPDDDSPGADAIVYLMRGLHTTDIEFLKTLNERTHQGSRSLGVVAVLSRADELGSARIDSMLSASRAAKQFREDAELQGLAQTLVPVAGLTALAGATLRQADFAALRELEAWPRPAMRALLLSADRFVEADDPGLPPAAVRADLMKRLGVFGIKLAIASIRTGARDAPTLSADLIRRSGLDELRRVLDVQFGQRHDQLKARSAIVSLRRLLIENPGTGVGDLLADVEECLADVHPLAEVRLLGRITTPIPGIDEDERRDLERLIGGLGTAPAERLGLSGTGAAPEVLRKAALAALWRWRERAENPLTDPKTAEACRIAARSSEGILADLADAAGTTSGWTSSAGARTSHE